MNKRMIVKLAWYDDIGRSRVLGRLLGAVSQILMVFTFLKVYGISFTGWQIAVAVVAWLALEILCGWVYNKTGFMQTETDLYNEQNKAIQEMLKK